jgi:hypothetical protein
MQGIKVVPDCSFVQRGKRAGSRKSEGRGVDDGQK